MVAYLVTKINIRNSRGGIVDMRSRREKRQIKEGGWAMVADMTIELCKMKRDV